MINGMSAGYSARRQETRCIAEATAFVYDALAVAGIERSAAIDKIIDGAIEAAVLALGHEEKPPDYGGGFGDNFQA